MKDGQYDGQGTFWWPDGSKYVGQFKVDLLSGQGAYAWPDGFKYVGEFRDNRPNGRGTFTFADGAEYAGEFKDGNYNGQGTFRSPAGITEQGEFRDGMPYRVSGTKTLAEGTVEVGTWNFDGTKSGGTITWKDGREYRGDWKSVDGAAELPDGTGTMTWPDGRKYVGQFRNGQMDGPGKMIHPDGEVLDGLWEQNGFMGTSTSP